MCLNTLPHLHDIWPTNFVLHDLTRIFFILEHILQSIDLVLLAVHHLVHPFQIGLSHDDGLFIRARLGLELLQLFLKSVDSLLGLFFSKAILRRATLEVLLRLAFCFACLICICCIMLWPNMLGMIYTNSFQHSSIPYPMIVNKMEGCILFSTQLSLQLPFPIHKCAIL